MATSGDTGSSPLPSQADRSSHGWPRFRSRRSASRPSIARWNRASSSSKRRPGSTAEELRRAPRRDAHSGAAVEPASGSGRDHADDAAVDESASRRPARPLAAGGDRARGAASPSPRAREPRHVAGREDRVRGRRGAAAAPRRRRARARTASAEPSALGWRTSRDLEPERRSRRRRAPRPAPRGGRSRARRARRPPPRARAGASASTGRPSIGSTGFAQRSRQRPEPACPRRRP